MPLCDMSAAFVQRATCPPGRKKIEYRDRTTIGWSLEVRASGGKTYYLRYFDKNGRQRQFKIGGVNDVTFDQARKKAKTLRADAVLGGDPMARKEEQKRIGTYADLAKLHIEEAKRTQRSWWSTEGIIKNKLVPRFGKMRVDEIAPQDIAKWLGELAETGLKPATIDKYGVTLGRSYSLGQSGACPAQRRTRSGPCPASPMTTRQRYLTAEEAKALKLACELSRNKALVHIVGLLILTGARKRELLDARWEHIDLERRLWFIPVTKNGKPRHVPLSQAAIDIINKLPKKKGCPWLLPNPSTGQPSASFLINSGIEIYQVGRILGHRDHKPTKRYAHVMNSTLLAAADAAAAKVNVGWAEPTK